MEMEQVEKIKYCRQTIKGILAEVEPANEEEWEVFETLTSIHKALRKIDLGKIIQQRMNLAPKGPAVEQRPLPDGIEGAMAVYGEDSLVEHPRIESEHERTIDSLTRETSQKKLVIRTPEDGADDQQFHIFIGESETIGFSLMATVLASLVEFGDKIPDCLCEEDQGLLRTILEAGAATTGGTREEKPKARRGRPRKPGGIRQWKP